MYHNSYGKSLTRLISILVFCLCNIYQLGLTAIPVSWLTGRNPHLENTPKTNQGAKRSDKIQNRPFD